MAWVRFDDKFDDDEDLAFLTPEAVCLHLCACTWSARKLTDGLIPEGQARRLLGYSEEAIKLLIERHWWVRQGDCFQIRNFLKYNPCKEQVLAEREGNRKRKAEWSQRQRQQADETPEEDGNTVSNAVTHTVTHEPGNTVPNGLKNGHQPVSRIPYSEYPETHKPGGAIAPAAPPGSDEDLVQHDEPGTFPPSLAAVAVWFHANGMPTAEARLQAEAMIDFHSDRKWTDPQGRQLYGWKSSARAWLTFWRKIKDGKARDGDTVAKLMGAAVDAGSKKRKPNSILSESTGGAA